MILVYFVLIISISAYDYHNNTSRIYIHEELPPSTLVFSSVSSSDNLKWLPSSFVFQKYFYLNQNQSLFTTNEIINREEFCEKKICQCSECLINLNFLQTFSTHNVSVRTIEIIIKDINDHSPAFKKAFIQFPIAENIPIDYEIPLESAIDNDYGLLSIQNYELQPMNNNNPFILIKRSKPVLKLNRTLDREIKSHYLLKLVAYDGGQPSLSGEQNIEIIVSDVNDNVPIFDQIIYRKSIPENQQVESRIFKIYASDLDEGENARISYSIDDQSVICHIDERTGEIYLKKSLDYEKQRSYSITIKAHDHGIPQLNNYVTFIIDVTDVNDHVPNVLLAEVNGTLMDHHQINLPECKSKDVPILYIHVTDRDSGDNSRVRCTLNDTRLSLIVLTTNAYSLQISGSPLFDYELEQSVVIHLQCTDFGLPALSTSILFNIEIDDCNDNPPEIIFPLRSNKSLLIHYETTDTPFILTQFIIRDRDRFQSNLFRYSFNVLPSLNLSLTHNGTLILCSMPFITGLFTINVTVYDNGNLTNTITIPVNIQSIDDTIEMRNFSMKNTSLILLLIFFIIVFLAAILISLCFLIACLLRTKNSKLQRNSKRISSSESTNSSNERAGSSQKTTIEVFEEATNSSNRIYQYGIKRASDMKVINTSGNHQTDFGYSEKVERYLTQLDSRETVIDRDEGVYGSSDVSSDHVQQVTIRPLSISSVHSPQQAYQDSLKRFEQLYALVERRKKANLNTSSSSSDSLYV
ncbi:unnamed protein product [Rotaria magnacalcarata]|uniref:Cadherin domain-containing protein n=2 Tax=Rotaria magnacalcarata TaxID=392030 RepID=A0A815ZT77_9BILA|nr:unnamed protein product [Rotaria magnacalcarata]